MFARPVGAAVLWVFLNCITGSIFAGDLPAQAQRGRELFLKSQKGIACATCHEVEAQGTAIGPNLTRLAKVVGPHELTLMMLAGVKQHVVQVVSREAVFDGILKAKQSAEIQVWDLSQTPPVLRTLTSDQIQSMKPDPTWVHPPREAGYTLEELADIMGFLRYTASGSSKIVRPSEVQASAGSGHKR